MIQCVKCGAEHLRLRAGGRPQSYCGVCHAAYMRDTRKPHSALTPEARRRANARSYANVYQRRGKLVPQPCACGCGAKPEKHHEDYSRPRHVDWMCRDQHLALHAELM